MKKILSLLLITITVLLTSCASPEVKDDTLDCAIYPNHVDCQEDTIDPVDPDPEVIEYDFIDIFYINDFHGGLLQEDGQIGVSGIASYLANHEETYPDNTIFIGGGDILQGSALSNYYNGYSTIQLMDIAGMDAFTVGNHEFDWGIETVTDYFDGDESNGEASFPLLAANIVYKGTNDLLEHAEPYTIIDIYDKKIGIIGTIGYGLEYSIATSKVEAYEFLYPVPIIASYAEHLRTTMDCDFVIWVGHDTGDINQAVADLEGNQNIDAIFNGHSHSEYAQRFLGIPELQSGDKGENLGHVRLYFNEDGEITDYNVENLDIYDSAFFSQQHPEIETLLNQFITETAHIFGTVYLQSAASYNKVQLSRWLAELERKYTNADIAFHNYGGTRTGININQDISMATLYEIWPFDNQLKTVTLKGDVVNYLIQYSGLAYDSSIEVFDNDQYYKVVTNDYVFDKPENPFIDGTNIEIETILLRDLVALELELQKEVYDFFDVANDIITDNTN